MGRPIRVAPVDDDGPSRDHAAGRGTFGDVYDRELLAVTRIAYLLVRSQAQAEELAHDAFVRLYERFDEVRNPAGFLRTVVARLALRSEDRRRMEGDRLRLVGGGRRDRDPEPEVDETWAALDRLRPERRAVLVLRFYADLPFDEIGRALGCTAATARGRAHRALYDLREELTP